MFHCTVDTSKKIEQAIESLEENLKAVQFGLLWQFDIKEKLPRQRLRVLQ
ncbi:hypothetical protein [Terribacillus sp. JSM ZJ617]